MLKNAKYLKVFNLNGILEEKGTKITAVRTKKKNLCYCLATTSNIRVERRCGAWLVKLLLLGKRKKMYR